jgi:phosphopantetheinyl transferase
MITMAQRQRMEANAALALLWALAAGVRPDPAGWRRGAGGWPLAPDGSAPGLSHTAGLAAVAIGSGPSALGIDVERRPRERDLSSLAAAAMSGDELATWHRLPPSARPRDLLARWTRKEAVLKALRVGLRTPPSAVAIDADGLIRALPSCAGDRSEWTLRDVDVPAATTTVSAGAIAIRAPNATVHVETLRIADVLPSPSTYRVPRRQTQG